MTSSNEEMEKLSSVYSVTEDGILESRKKVIVVDDDENNDGTSSNSSIVVQRVPARLLEGSDENSYDWCNTCNHDTEFKMSLLFDTTNDDDNNDGDDDHSSGIRRWRAWYDTRKKETSMDNWYPLLCEDNDDYGRTALILNITPAQQQKYIKPASHCAWNDGRAKRLYEDEADALASELLLAQNNNQEQLLLVPPEHGWFVRTASCSPKDSFKDGGAGPHFSVQEALLALMASERVHTTLQKTKYGDTDTTMKVYLIPFDPDVTVERELRVFVHNNTVTAISQYDVYSSSSVFAPMSHHQLVRVAKAVQEFHTNVVKPRWTINTSYTMDIECILLKKGVGSCSDTTDSASHDDDKEKEREEEDDDEIIIRLIELNSFGAEMAAASALFHWERDNSILYNRVQNKNTNNSENDDDPDDGTKKGRNVIYIRVRE